MNIPSQRIWCFLQRSWWENAAQTVINAGGLPVLIADTEQDILAFNASTSPTVSGSKQALFVPAHVSANLSLASNCNPACFILDCDHFLLPEGQLSSRLATLSSMATVIMEVNSQQQAESAMAAGATGLLAKGNECSGLVGGETTSVLVRILAMRFPGVFIAARGGIGPDTAAAMTVLGAEALVLDDQLLLLPGSPITEELRNRLTSFDGFDTRLVGIQSGIRYRVYAQVATKPPKLAQQADISNTLRGGTPLNMAARYMTDTINPMVTPIGAGMSLGTHLWPLGQHGAFASGFAQRFQTLEVSIQAMDRLAVETITEAAAQFPLSRGNALATDEKVTFPIHQGPMAQITDVAQFAKAVADNGAVPFLALGSMPGSVARELMIKTRNLLGDKPFGVGLIGMETNKVYREAHLQLISELHPPMALIAAGSAEMAMQVVSTAGIPAYLHTPTASMLKGAIATGVRHFILEGHEAGGHVGSLVSYVLWQLGVWEIESAIAAGTINANQVYLNLAGGIDDARSGAATACVLIGLQKKGVRVGAQVGTAYLLSEEALTTGALGRKYQQVCQEADSTVVLGEDIGAPTRVIDTPAANRAIKADNELAKSGAPRKERKEAFEHANLGGLRTAAKGQRIKAVIPGQGAIFEQLTEEYQIESGLFHAGQGVAVMDKYTTIPQIHSALTDGAVQMLTQAANKIASGHHGKSRFAAATPTHPTVAAAASSPIGAGASAGAGTASDICNNPASTDHGKEPIAIVGMALQLPGANSKEQYWDNIIKGVVSIGDVPAGRWDPSIYYTTDRQDRDKSYTKVGGWLGELTFDGRKFRIPPRVMSSTDPVQLLALSITSQALEDAGLHQRDFDRSRAAVIFGNALGGEFRDISGARAFMPEMLDMVSRSLANAQISGQLKEQILRNVQDSIDKSLLPFTEDSMPGELANIIAGRVASAFDLGGPSYICDAACASSAAAFNAAIHGLRDHQFDIAVTGGIDRSMSPGTFIKFCRIGALSPNRSAPFDKSANGFVMGEGGAVFILKRLEDAVRDRDRIYATILGIGGASDGKGKGITAPNVVGQIRALNNAYQNTGIDPATVDMIEAHGTGTPVGDVVEANALKDVWKSANRTKPVLLGSVKSQIGHLKSAAAAASMAKVILAIQNKTLPGQVLYEGLNPALELEGTPFRVTTSPQPWENNGSNHPRRGGFSTFGFGGVNFHCIVEEYVEGGATGRKVHPVSRGAEDEFAAATTPIAYADANTSTNASSCACTGLSSGLSTDQTKSANCRNEILGHVVLLGDVDRASLLNKTKAALETLTTHGVVTGNGGEALNAPIRLALSGMDTTELREGLERAVATLEGRMAPRMLEAKGGFLREGPRVGKTAFLFPGQGSQRLGMTGSLRQYFGCIDRLWLETDRLSSQLMKQPLSQIVLPDEFPTEEAQKAAFKRLCRSEFAQPGVFVADLVHYDLLVGSGIKPDAVAGHSLGEYAAAVAAGVIDFEDGFKAVIGRGKAMDVCSPDDPGKMASIATDSATVEKVLSTINGYVVVANRNCSTQTVIAGTSAAVMEAMARFNAMEIQTIPLPASHAFHSEIVRPAAVPLRKLLDTLNMKEPDVPIVSNVTADYYPSGCNAIEKIKDLLGRQVASQVNFIGCVERLYNDGVRLFVEVGPRRTLAAFVGSILSDNNVRTYAACDRKVGEERSFIRLLAALAAEGYKGALDLCRGRDLPSILLNEGATANRSEAVASPAAAVANSAISVVTTTNSIPTSTDINDDEEQEEMAKQIQTGITGVAIGLPGRDRVFSEDNFDVVLNGHNLIGNIDRKTREQMVEKGMVRLVKDSNGNGTFKSVTDPEDAIHLAGIGGKLDLVTEYGVPAELAGLLDRSAQLAMAAGIEALRDAGLPLVKAYRTTRTGAKISNGWSLPEEIGNDTGVILASAFPGLDSMARGMKQQNENDKRQARIDELKSLLATTSDSALRNSLQDRIDALESIEKEPFSRHFLMEILSMGHSQLAQWIGAKGPNTQVNSACASTTMAVGMAQDWIRTGRAKRVLIVGADDITTGNLLDWMGSAFLVTGAATDAKRVEDGALPFDRRRRGMIIGMGAVGLVVETMADAKARGIEPLVQVLGTRFCNSAFHGQRLDTEHIAHEVNQLITDAEQDYGLDRREMAPKTMFMSHETYTPARGGSAAAEIAALRNTFGEVANQVIVANTKGFTGHPMGAGLEDAVSIKALYKGIVPPIPNLKEPDPDLGDLRLSDGGRFNLEYAIRLGAGFGSQLALTLVRKVARSGMRFQPDVYRAWLRSISGLERPVVKVVAGTLRVEEDDQPARAAADQNADLFALQDHIVEPAEGVGMVEGNNRVVASTSATACAGANPGAGTVNRGAVATALLNIISNKTGYGLDELQEEYELEADLGVDTVKQAEILATVREMYNLERDESFRLADYSTIRSLIDYTVTRAGGDTSAPATAAAATTTADAGAGTVNRTAVAAALLNIISDKTGYGLDELQEEYELEADLGVDTVKQAEILATVREMYNLERDESFRLADYSTIRSLIDYTVTRAGGDTTASAASATTAAAAAPSASAAATTTADASAGTVNRAAVAAALLNIISDKTGYGLDELQEEYELEADLGVDTVKQAEILATVREMYHLERDESFRLADYSTIRSLIDYTVARASGADSEAATTASATTAPTATIATDSAPANNTEAMAAQASAATNTRTFPLPEPFTCRRAVLVDAPATNTKVKVQGNMALVVGGDQYSELFCKWLTAATIWHVTIDPATALNLGREGKLADWLKKEGLKPDQAILINLMPLERNIDGFSKQNVEERTSALHHLAQAWQSLSAQGKPAGRIVTVTRGCRLGLQPSYLSSPYIGAQVGYTKALCREWENRLVKVLDLAPELLDDTPDKAMPIFTEELQSDDSLLEICRTGDGNRYTSGLGLTREEGVQPPVVDKNTVVLASGGAQGITAHVVKHLALKGCQFMLLGLVTLDPQDKEAAALANEDELKVLARRRLQEAGKPATPMAIKRWMSPYLQRLEILSNMEAIRKAGATSVDYMPCDVTDKAQVDALFSTIRAKYGKLDGIIHAAGRQISRYLSEKTETELVECLSPKVGGALNMWNNLGDFKPRFIVTFGSVAGRFGNVGQVDYSSANAALSYLSSNINGTVGTGTLAFTVDWTAWGQVGMAARGGMAEIMEKRGVDMLPPEIGQVIVPMALEKGCRGEWVVAGRMGDMCTEDEAAGAKAAELPPVEMPTAVFIKRLPRMEQNVEILELTASRAVLRRKLDPTKDSFLYDHAIEGVPVLPGVMGLEFIANAATLLFPDANLAGFANVSWNRPVKVMRDKPVEITVEANVIGNGLVQAVLRSARPGIKGRMLNSDHFFAEVRFAGADTEPARGQIAAPAGFTLPAVTGGKKLGKDWIYKAFFHGPTFQVISGITGNSDAGITVEGYYPEGSFGTGISSPLMRELELQTAGLWAVINRGSMALPAAVDTVNYSERVNERDNVNRSDSSDSTRFEARAISLGQDERGLWLFDVEVRSLDGRYHDRMTGLRMIPTGPSLPVAVEEVVTATDTDTDIEAGGNVLTDAIVEAVAEQPEAKSATSKGKASKSKKPADAPANAAAQTTPPASTEAVAEAEVTTQSGDAKAAEEADGTSVEETTTTATAAEERAEDRAEDLVPLINTLPLSQVLTEEMLVEPVLLAIQSGDNKLASTWLTSEEMDQFKKFRKKERKAQWLAARVVAKKLLIAHISQVTGLEVTPRQISVWRNEGQAPQWKIVDSKLSKKYNGNTPPKITISHCNGKAVAGLSAQGFPGVDVEEVAARDASFAKHCFTDGERDNVGDGDETLTSLWAIKEAVSKALCLGLKIDPREIEVLKLTTEGLAEMTLHGMAKEQMEKLGGESIHAHVEQFGTHVIARAYLKASGSKLN